MNRKNRSKIDTSQNGAAMHATRQNIRHPAPHPSSKPATLTSPSCSEHPSVTAPAGWASFITSRVGRCDRLSST